MSRCADLPDGIHAWMPSAHGMSRGHPRTILRNMLASLLTHCRGAILSVQKPPAAQRNPRIGSSPLNQASTAPPSSPSDSAPPSPEPTSPKKTSKPADGPPPASPGARQVKAAIGSVQKLAQTELKLKRKHIADERAASYWWERSLEKVAESDKASKHHKTLEVIGKLSAQAHKALERYESLNTAALCSHVHLLKVSVAKQEARVLVREAKMCSLRRRLRKRRLLGLCRW